MTVNLELINGIGPILTALALGGLLLIIKWLADIWP
jgi:hypothetical protein